MSTLALLEPEPLPLTKGLLYVNPASHCHITANVTARPDIGRVRNRFKLLELLTSGVGMNAR